MSKISLCYSLISKGLLEPENREVEISRQKGNKRSTCIPLRHQRIKKKKKLDSKFEKYG